MAAATLPALDWPGLAWDGRAATPCSSHALPSLGSWPATASSHTLPWLPLNVSLQLRAGDTAVLDLDASGRPRALSKASLEANNIVASPEIVYSSTTVSVNA